MFKMLVEAAKLYPMLTGFIGGNVTGSGATILGGKLWKLARYKLTGRRK